MMDIDHSLLRLSKLPEYNQHSRRCSSGRNVLLPVIWQVNRFNRGDLHIEIVVQDFAFLRRTAFATVN